MYANIVMHMRLRIYQLSRHYLTIFQLVRTAAVLTWSIFLPAKVCISTAINK